MDLSKFQKAFETMSYDLKNKLKIHLRKLCATFIITETSDIETASDYIAAYIHADDQKLISSILVQESINDKFKVLLSNKIKDGGNIDEVINLSQKGFEVIAGRIVKCPQNIIANQDSPVISYEVFRTTKEGISLAKSATSISLWGENISIAYEYIYALNANQIWLNTFCTTHPKIPFLSEGKETICDDKDKKSNQTIIEVADNVHFQTTFQNGTFKTVVIPFGETFAN